MVDPKTTSLPPAPSASGSLAQKPLAHLLIYSRERQLTGTLELRATEGRVLITLTGGKVAKVHTTEAVAYLGHVLYELGYIDDVMLSQSLAEVASTKRLHGSILLEKKAITPPQLLEGLRQLRERKLEYALTLPPSTEFAFYNHVDLVADRPNDVDPADPLRTVWHVLRQSPPAEQVRTALAKIDGHALRVPPSIHLTSLGLVDQERAAAECLRLKALTVPELAAAGFLPLAMTELLAYFLLVTKHVEVVERAGAAPVQPQASSIPPGMASSFGSGQYAKQVSFTMQVATPVHGSEPPAPGFASSVPPKAASSVPPKIASSVPPKAASSVPPKIASSVPPKGTSSAPPKVASSTPPKPSSSAPPRSFTPSMRPGASMPPQATTSSMPPRIATPGGTATPADVTRRHAIVERARTVDSEDYFKLLHVDRGATSEEIRESFFRLAKQWHPDTLTAPLSDLRAEAQRIFVRMTAAYETLMNADRRRDYEERIGARAQDATEADTFFAQAEMEMVLGDVKKAEQLCRRALITYSGRPEYAALLAWLEALEPPKRTPEFVRTKIGQLDAAIAKDAKCRHAYYYRGMLYSRLDDHDNALRDLRRAVEQDPDDADAIRELRAYEKAVREGAITLRRTTPPPGAVKKPSSGLFEKFRKK